MKKPLSFENAFKYPFNRAKGLLNVLWFLLPIVGWFALGGYGVRIVKEFTKGKFKKLPIFEFGKDLELGFMMFIKAIPFILVYGLIAFGISMVSPFIRVLTDILVVPILSINFMSKQTVSSFFEIKVLKYVFSNFGDYLLAVLKSILLGVIFLVMWIVLVGIPAGSFTKNIFLADFYRRNVK